MDLARERRVVSVHQYEAIAPSKSYIIVEDWEDDVDKTFMFGCSRGIQVTELNG
jgi:hypothetical protein